MPFTAEAVATAVDDRSHDTAVVHICVHSSTQVVYFNFFLWQKVENFGIQVKRMDPFIFLLVQFIHQIYTQL